MRNFIRKIGQAGTVAFLSALAIAVAMLSTLAFTMLSYRLNVDLDIKALLLISVLVTLTIAPIMIWHMTGLFLKVDQLEAEMRLLATYDSLTGLLNRREFLERANYFHKVAFRENLPYALIIADLDNFKEINDEFGHLTGNQVLENIGRAILENMRESDLACRFGGDEFLFFLPNSSPDQAHKFGNRLQSIAEEALGCSWLEIELSISLGIASYPEIQAENIEDMISAADNALSQAKRSGGNKTQHYNLDNIPDNNCDY